MKIKSFTFIFLLLVSHSMLANVTLPNIFSDNMVLQRNSEVSIWGWAEPREEIKIVSSWNNVQYTVLPSPLGKWEIKIKTPEAGGPYFISFKAYNEIVLKNILIGEVWLCSGQSNMAMTANWGIENGDAEVKNATNPNIRFFTVPKLTADCPQNNLPGEWNESTPETMKDFSAIGYFFAQRLQNDLKNVPIGLVSSNWGGTPAEIWMPEEVIQNDKILLTAANKIKEGRQGPSNPGTTYNAMIYPLVGFKIAGVLWYQGESNVGATTYEKTFEALINSWRDKWKQDFPFYFVQIAPYNYSENVSGAAVIRNAQRLVAKNIPNTGMVVTTDISTIDDIHPKDKKTVGVRLANLALADTYKLNTNLVNGPLFKNFTIEKNKIIVSFDYSDGLHFSTSKEMQFEVAGADGIYYPAEAVIKNNVVIVKSKKVSNPKNVRYAWLNISQSNLFNSANLPASSFISE